MSTDHFTMRDVRVSYGRAAAVRGVTVSVPPASITAIVGPNGAGKSSLLLGVQGVISAQLAELTMGGRSLLRMSSTQRAKAGMILVPQGRQLFPSLSVRVNLQIVADALGLDGSRVEEALERFPILGQRHRHPAGVLSGGEQQMLALARALMSRPSVLLLDEPTEGLAPVIVAEVRTVLERIRDDGGTVVIAEPTTRLLPEQIDHGYVIMRGAIVAEAGSRQELREAFAAQFAGMPALPGKES